MAKASFLDYLDEQLQKKITEYDTAIDWNKKNHSIEVIVRLFAENQSHEESIDADGIVSSEDIIEIEDGVLFYHPIKSTFDVDYYLTTIPYDEKKGLQKGAIDAFVTYFKEVLDEGQSDLLDYVTKEDVIEFELKWKKEDYDALVAEKLQLAGGEEYLPYPKY
ncbi:MAG: DUF3013 family protein [Lactobacillales bacterium]|jgi:hypothetical protein|nr:DUF3013 family protein [Lactobacillales bacterium]